MGELTYAANSAGTYTYQYNSLGQKTQQVWTDANGDALTLNYTYDASGNLTLETDSQGNTLSFVYNGEGLMTTEIATSSTGTVARTQWSYNAEQQITQIQDYTVASGGTAVLTINNSYDINGNLTTETETGSGVSVTYVNTYDADNRITSEVRNGVTVTYGYNAESEVTSAGSQTNSFDANGNLTNSGFSTGTYNEINTDGTWSYYYDGVGNMVEKINLSSSVTWNYAYDMDYQLTSAVETNAGGTVLASGSYSYDVFNNLVAETITTGGMATTSKFAFDGSQIYADLSSTGSVQTLYVTGMSDGNGQLYARIQSGTLYWIVQDRQGSVREIINSSGSSILDAITYTDDGGIQSQTGSTYLGNYGYTGLRYDSLTTYWVAVNRWYNSAIDQWIEMDPEGYAGRLSDLRDYVGNNWTNAVDLSGLIEVTEGKSSDTASYAQDNLITLPGDIKIPLFGLKQQNANSQVLSWKVTSNTNEQGKTVTTIVVNGHFYAGSITDVTALKEVLEDVIPGHTSSMVKKLGRLNTISPKFTTEININIDKSTSIEKPAADISDEQLSDFLNLQQSEKNLTNSIRALKEWSNANPRKEIIKAPEQLLLSYQTCTVELSMKQYLFDQLKSRPNKPKPATIEMPKKK